MRLPKHKLAKNPSTHGAHKATSERTKKHKAYKHISEGKVEEINDALMQVAAENSEENNNDEEQLMDLAETGSTNQSRPKTKEEKKAIRELRHKANAARNLYKVRNGNYSGKNGPRAINRGKNA